MKNLDTIGLSCLFAAALALSAPQPASAITAELAKQCRAMATKAYPPAKIGTKPTGNAKSGLAYYRACIENNGTMPNTPAAAAPPPK